MTVSANPTANSKAASRGRGGLSGVRRATPREKVRREERIVGLLNRGASVPEIAASEGLTLKRMRNVVREILADRLPLPPAEFLALQVSRLNEALLVSFTSMHTESKGTNFEAVDRVVKIVRELDRYHGFAAVPRPHEEAEARRLPPPAEAPLALQSPRDSDSLAALQSLEKAQSGLVSERDAMPYRPGSLVPENHQIED
jgi:hypothetical protein